MSFTRLKYDPKCQQEAFNDTLAPGKYALETPLSCQPCFQDNPQILLQKNGGSISRNEKNLFFRGPIDVESELRNLNRVASKCPAKRRPRMPRNNGLFDSRKRCHFPVDNTLLTNPSANLKGQETLRLDFPPMDPQKHIIFRGRLGINTRLEVKDNHRPCIEVPLSSEMNPGLRN